MLTTCPTVGLVWEPRERKYGTRCCGLLGEVRWIVVKADPS